MWVEVAVADAAALGVAEGDLVEVRSARGAIRARARVNGIRPGVVFVPFHYGDGDGGAQRAANELTLTAWDPVSKQPVFKVAAVGLTKVGDGGGDPSPAPMIGGSAP